MTGAIRQSRWIVREPRYNLKDYNGSVHLLSMDYRSRVRIITVVIRYDWEIVTSLPRLLNFRFPLAANAHGTGSIPGRAID